MRVSPGAIQIQPLWGWERYCLVFYSIEKCYKPGFIIHPPGFTWGYSNSTPLGLGTLLFGILLNRKML
jgi:hypothetical protein